MSKSKWRRFKPLAAIQASQELPKAPEMRSKPVALVGVIAVLIVGLGIAAYAANDLLRGHITFTGHPNKTAPADAVSKDAERSTLPNTAATSSKSASDLVDKYGTAADSPAVAAAIRKAESGAGSNNAGWIAGTNAASDAYEALQHGVWKPGADPMLAIMHGYVPPNMDPQQARMLYNTLPHLPKSPRRGPMTKEMADQLASSAEDPSAYDQESIRAANQRMLESHMRQRFGPVYVPPLHRDHNRVVSQKDNQMSLIEPEYSFDPGAGRPPRTYNPAAGSHSITEMTDASGNVVSQYRYDPYGRQTKIGGTGPDADFGYQGYYVHQRSGLNLTATRAYSPVLGRFISRDSIEEVGGVNLYTYVKNDPINFADPSGQKAQSSRCVLCPYCDNPYGIGIPMYCTEETRTTPAPGGGTTTYTTTYFTTTDGRIYQAVPYGDADQRAKNGQMTCYWQRTQ